MGCLAQRLRSIHLRNLHHPLTKQWGAWRNAYVKKVGTPRRRCPKHETRRAVLWDTMAPPTSALRDYGLASQARETDGDGAPSLPFGKGRVARSKFYRKLWRFRRLEATTLTAPAAGGALCNAYK
jgi:hypothetical protein